MRLDYGGDAMNLGFLIKTYFQSLSKEERRELLAACVHGISEDEIVDVLGGDRRVAEILMKGFHAMNQELREKVVRSFLGEERYKILERLKREERGRVKCPKKAKEV